VLLGVGALQAVGAALGSLARLWVVGGSFLPYLRAALRPEVVGLPGPTAAGTLELRGGVAGYDPQRPVLRGVDLHIQPGSRWLVEGESGAGKSTLLRVLAGLMPLQGGQLRYAGWDQAALSRAQWRSLVALTPQSHDNHIFSDSLAFNLLMGRAWPPDPEDLDQAKALCQAVGLGPMLERMPSGLNQLVGEGGWQLSQGEQSRVVLLRALLQDSQVLVLDESFAALDPETLGQCMGALWERPGTLVVVAHP
ncbi:MAG TPA: ATP-binding cassette domain-containing protein, partial [Myxococcota bacterium]|nr:ATP-binding cassette domain-containing protein [Myxococcota bacterium]